MNDVAWTEHAKRSELESTMAMAENQVQTMLYALNQYMI